MKRPPVVFDFPSDLDPLHAFKCVADWQNVIFFASTRTDTKLGRYSFLAAEPVSMHRLQDNHYVYGTKPFFRIARQLNEYDIETIPDLPPFQGGAAGFLSYELGRCWEQLPSPVHDEFRMPGMFVGIYEWVLAWDHHAQKCWLIVQNRSQKDAYTVWDRLREVLADRPDPDQEKRDDVEEYFSKNSNPQPIETPQFALDQLPGLTSNFSHETYLEAVQRVIDYIHAGDIFQANLSQRLLYPTSRTPVENFLSLAKQNPAPFAGYVTDEDWAVISSSPERFVKVNAGEVSTRPIKGTRQRHFIPEADLYARDELRESAKDRAENVMIVDLLRNDLSRVCKPGTIKVPELCTIEAYETVTHLVSEVRGQLRDDATFWDLIAVTFPGGSITGAPKIRAMEIITELEQVTRGPYCGSLFYHGFDGTADSSILIRTMTQRHGHLQLPVGGGIVADSIPEQEYQETLHKAGGMLKALEN